MQTNAQVCVFLRELQAKFKLTHGRLNKAMTCSGKNLAWSTLCHKQRPKYICSLSIIKLNDDQYCTDWLLKQHLQALEIE
jgi:hypothetical protein